MEDTITIILSRLKSFWLTCDKSKSRWQDMENMLVNLKFKSEMLNGEITNPYTIGVAKNHIDAINKSNSEFCIILEDDARLTNNIINEITIPKNCDALYLGTSQFGKIRGESIFGGVISSSYNDYLLKIYNMLSLHAVVYISKRYKDHVVNTLKNFIKNPEGGMDDPLAMSMHKYNIYALKLPMFYQNDGHSEHPTTAILNPLF